MQHRLIPLALLLLLAWSPAGAQLPDLDGAQDGFDLGGIGAGIGDPAGAVGDVISDDLGNGSDAARSGNGSTPEYPVDAVPGLDDGLPPILESLGLENLPGNLMELGGNEALIFDRSAIETAATGNDRAYVPDELIVLDPSTSLLNAAQAQGFRILSVERFANLDVVIARLRVPTGLSLSAARQRLDNLVDRQLIEFNSLYRRDQAQWVVPHEAIWGQVGWLGPCAATVGIGIVDTAIDPSVAAAAAVLEQRDIREGGGRSVPGEHGSAVAAILAGGSVERPGLLSGIALSVAAAFPADLSEPADTPTMLRALDWLASRDVEVINFSLSGPRNDILAVVLTSLDEAGVAFVAAVGNAGASQEPGYPAAHPAVLGVTAIGPDSRVLAVATRGAAVDLAAPGIAVPSIGIGGQPIRVTGTSFAAPFVTAAVALLAAQGWRPVEIREHLMAASRDLGSPGRDDIFGHGALVAPGCNGIAPSRSP